MTTLNDILGDIINRNPWWRKNSSNWLADELAQRGVGITEDTGLLDWLDTLPNGITIHGDAAFQQSLSMTPKASGFSHTRDLIRQAMRGRA